LISRSTFQPAGTNQQCASAAADVLSVVQQQRYTSRYGSLHPLQLQLQPAGCSSSPQLFWSLFCAGKCFKPQGLSITLPSCLHNISPLLLLLLLLPLLLLLLLLLM
jgi:hypothetical protein